MAAVPDRRAIVCFVEENEHLIQQTLALRHSWLHVRSPDTDMVVMGPGDVLARLPDDLVKIEQRPAADDPVWQDYRYANSIACMNAAGAEQLDRYTHVLRTDVDTFITPAWNQFYPAGFTCGRGAYSNDDDIRQRIGRIAAEYGLVHRGLTNVGSTWYGPTELVRRACAFSEMLLKHILTRHFASDTGEWPGWCRGVALLYAGEIAVNHCAPDARTSDLLDGLSTSKRSTLQQPHIHCWHTDDKFSKHWFMSRRYTLEDAQNLDPDVVADYCMEMSFRSLADLDRAQRPRTFDASALAVQVSPDEATRAPILENRVEGGPHEVGSHTESCVEEIELTIGMATYRDFDGVYFTLQALRLYQDLRGTELLVVDNYGCQDTKNLVEGWLKGTYVLATDAVGTAAPRDLVFREARGEAVLCCDSHVLFPPGVVARLKRFYREHPDCNDLLQGPLLYDDAQTISTHFDPTWRAQMWGTWATDPRGLDPEGEPFDIPMQGLGAFSCRRSAWPGFNSRFRGFGGEEGYIHEKFRQAGGRCLCLPWFRWMHRFSRPSGVPYPLTIEDKFRNYVIGHAELGLDLKPVLEHFSAYLPKEKIIALTVDGLWGKAEGTSS
jgi:hypothetical protein